MHSFLYPTTQVSSKVSHIWMVDLDTLAVASLCTGPRSNQGWPASSTAFTKPCGFWFSFSKPQHSKIDVLPGNLGIQAIPKKLNAISLLVGGSENQPINSEMQYSNMSSTIICQLHPTATNQDSVDLDHADVKYLIFLDRHRNIDQLGPLQLGVWMLLTIFNQQDQPLLYTHYQTEKTMLNELWFPRKVAIISEMTFSLLSTAGTPL